MVSPDVSSSHNKQKTGGGKAAAAKKPKFNNSLTGNGDPYLSRAISDPEKINKKRTYTDMLGDIADTL